MPKPVTLPCFLDTLARPLQFHATQSIFSLQPAAGLRSPRIFLFSGPLIMSVVPEGTGSSLLEFGELRSESRSLKGEIEFPVTAELPDSAPYERILFNPTLTSCGFCHAAEEPAADLPLVPAFVSQALRPRPNERTSLDVVFAQWLACDATAEPARCAMLKSLFERGEIVEHDFPSTLGTF
jgi:hypothetical protein